MPDPIQNLKGYQRSLCGALGGLSAVFVKFLGQDYNIIVEQTANLTPNQINSFIIGYSLLMPILIILGAILSWVTQESNRLKLFAIGVAAPALITTWAGGGDTASIAKNIDLVNSTYAHEQTIKPDTLLKNEQYQDQQSKSFFEEVSDGIKIFFGKGKEIKLYWVIVGSFKNRDTAQEYANLINNADSSLNAFVGIKVPPNEYYPVIVGDYEPYNRAMKVKEKALKLVIINDAYLSLGAVR